MEIQTSNDSDAKKKKMRNILFTWSIADMIVKSITTFILNVNRPEHPQFYSSLSLINKSFNIYWLSWIAAVTVYSSHVYFIVGEMVPVFVFYHAGCAMEDVERELKDALSGAATCSSGTINSPARAWRKYETVR